MNLPGQQSIKGAARKVELGVATPTLAGASSTSLGRKHCESRSANKRTLRHRHDHPLSGCNANDRAIPVNNIAPRNKGRVPQNRPVERFICPKRAGRFHVERGEGLDLATCRKPRYQAPGVVLRLDQFRPGSYGSPVAVSPAADLGRSSSNRRTSAKQYTGAFLLPAFYGSCARDTLGCAGFLFARSANLRTAATILRLAANGGSSQIGATPMTHIHAPNPSASHAAAWKARALAALRGNSSLSVRLRRYNQAMARARSLEAQQEVAHV